MIALFSTFISSIEAFSFPKLNREQTYSFRRVEHNVGCFPVGTKRRASHQRDGDFVSTTEDRISPRKFRQRTFDLIQKRKFVPVLIAFTLGLILGRSSYSGSWTDDSSKLVRVGSRRSLTAMKLLLFSLLVWDAWRLVPIWIKRQLPGIGRRYYRLPVNENDMTSLPTIGNKLKSVFKAAQQKMIKKSDLVVPAPHVYFAVLARIFAQIQKDTSADRDSVYASSGILAERSTKEFRGLVDLFEFADWAYDELPENKPLAMALKESDFSLLRHDKIAEPGSVAHYVAVSKSRKQVLIGVKGSSNFEDLLTDCCMEAQEYKLQDQFTDDSLSSITVHEGILRASKKLLKELDLFMGEFVLPSDYRVVITGHSLGAGVASILGILLRSHFSELRRDNERLKVWAFAPPPCLDLDASLACQHFTTTIVNNADLIPRWSLQNLLIVMKVLEKVYQRMTELGMTQNSFTLTRSLFQIFQNETSILSAEEMRVVMDQARNQIELDKPDHLYVPGKVLHMYDHWVKSNSVNNAAEALNSRTVESLLLTDGTSDSLRYVEINGRMLSDHLSPAYRSNIRTILSLLEEEE